MPVIRFLFVALVLISAPQTAFAMDAQAESYEALVSRLMSGDTDIDYAAFRRAYTMSDGYSPYYFPPLGEMYGASQNGDHAGAIAVVNEALESNYTDMDAHIVASYSYDQLGDAANAEYHWNVATGLRDSIANSGDGQTADTAYVAMNINEESAFLRSQGLTKTMQALLTNSDGAPVDAISVVDAESGDPRLTVFFDISASVLWMEQNLPDPDAPANEESPDTP